MLSSLLTLQDVLIVSLCMMEFEFKKTLSLTTLILGPKLRETDSSDCAGLCLGVLG